ncbi:hypothetical protein L9G16_24215, partial [Shewanella sp. A25]|nr:hypothetical protein [Shewanella shenzhenensis]
MAQIGDPSSLSPSEPSHHFLDDSGYGRSASVKDTWIRISLERHPALRDLYCFSWVVLPVQTHDVVPRVAEP